MFEVNSSLKYSDLSNCSENLTKTPYFICQCGIGRPTLPISTLSDHRHCIPQKTLRKIPENSENYNRGI